MFIKTIIILLESLYRHFINTFGIFDTRYNFYAGFITVVTIISILLIIYTTFKMEKNRLYFGFVFLLSVITLWLYAILQKYIADTHFHSIAWLKVEYLARLFTAIAWYIFAEVYIKRKERINKNLITTLLLGGLVIYVFVTMTNPDFHQNKVLHMKGLVLLPTYLLTTLITVISIIKLNRYALRQRGIFIKQVQLITTGVFFVLVIDLISSLRLTRIMNDLVPFGILIFDFFMWKAITKYRLMELVPIALREVFNNMSDGVVVLNEDGSIIDMNCKASSYVSNYYNPKIDVTIFDIILNMSNCIDDGPILLSQVKEVIKCTKEEISSEIKIKYDNPSYFLIKLGPIYDNRNKPIGFLVNIDNVTTLKNLIIENEKQTNILQEQNEELEAQKEELEAQKQELQEVNLELTNAYKELQNTQAKLIQTEKMAALGQLVAGVAHEINTPLGSINSNIEINQLITSKLLNKNNNEEESRKLIEKIVKVNDINSIACARILNIVKSLKNFSRLDEAEFQKVDIHQGIDSTLILLNNQIKNRIVIHKNYGEIPEIECYPNQLNQVFMNILVNSSQAIENKGDIYIKTFISNNKVFVEFTDSGKGINEDSLAKIFDPGFTTKGVGVGTGLGLSISYKIIEKHNGSITVSNTENLGARFLIELPVKNS